MSRCKRCYPPLQFDDTLYLLNDTFQRDINVNILYERDESHARLSQNT